MRLFVAVKISEELQEEILGWSRFFSRRMSGLKNRGSSMAGPSGEKNWLSRFPEGNRGSSMAKPSGPVRWLAGKNLHITLISPWESEGAEKTKKTKAVLKTLERKIGPFEMVFERVEFGPHFDEPPHLRLKCGGEPRLIWAEGAAPKEIQNLKIRVENVLGKAPENRPFKLHLTLARFHPKDFVRFPIKKLDEKVFWRQEVKSFVLMESRLLPDGADYEVLEEVIL